MPPMVEVTYCICAARAAAVASPVWPYTWRPVLTASERDGNAIDVDPCSTAFDKTCGIVESAAVATGVLPVPGAGGWLGGPAGPPGRGGAGAGGPAGRAGAG